VWQGAATGQNWKLSDRLALPPLKKEHTLPQLRHTKAFCAGKSPRPVGWLAGWLAGFGFAFFALVSAGRGWYDLDIWGCGEPRTCDEKEGSAW
jgi:hypothetical protein